MDSLSPLPPEEKTSVTALILSVLVHALLIGGLFFGVQWKNQAPSSVAVEVWRGAAMPVAVNKPEPLPKPKPLPKPEPTPEPPPPPPPDPAPIPEPPPPPPPPEPKPELLPPIDPDIAIKEEEQKKERERLERERLERERLERERLEQERLEKERLEKERLEKERLEKERLEKERLEKERLEKERLEKERLEKERLEKERLEKERLEKERLEKERKEELQKKADQEAQLQKKMRDMIAGADAEIRKRQAEQATAARARAKKQYENKISAKIRGNTVLPRAIQGNPEAVFRVTQLPSGEIIDVRLGKSSGNKLLDEAFERAIRKSSPLPLPDQPDLFERVLELKQRPSEE